jgi:uncharacterized membrane protein YdjX (TVP38/TMEM64 family)
MKRAEERRKWRCAENRRDNAIMPEPDRPSRRFQRLIPLGLLFLAAIAFMLSGGRHYLTFAALAEHREMLSELVARNSVLAALGFMLVYAGLTALSVPGAMLMTLTGGFLFGTWLGGGYALIGATLGAYAVFLAARAGLSTFADQAGPRIRRLRSGFREDAFNYLLCLRLMPIFPFWLVNLVAGASGMSARIYVSATLLGMIPGAFVYASIGNCLGDLIASGQRPDHYAIFRPNVLLPLLGLTVLALLPVVYKRWNGRRQSLPALDDD